MFGNSSHGHQFIGPQVDLALQSPFSHSQPQATGEIHSSDSDKELSPDKINPITRRPRGRPAGSKNKPKVPTVITQDNPNSLRSHVLEVTVGNDVVESLSSYARKRGRGISVIGGNGFVSNVTIRQAVGHPTGGVVNLQGRFELLSLTGTVLPPPAPPGAGGLSVFLGGGQGQVVGGLVIGPLIASTSVVLMAASFANAVFERLSIDREEEVQPDESSSGVTGGGGGGTNGALFNVPNYFAGDQQLAGWGGSNAGGRPTF